jgi:iron(III) transport system ATP-binding protein
MAEIQIRGLTVSYGDNIAVNGIDIDVADGELLVLLGPSGCGKTTTMRSIAGLETPVSGSIRVGDRVLFDSEQNLNIPASQRNIGMVFQSYAIWPHKTVIDNVAFPLRVKRTPRSQIRGQALEALELVGLTDLADRGASKLSGGQMQRVALARSLVMKPQALLLDEPLSNLDAKLRERLRFEIKALL